MLAVSEVNNAVLAAVAAFGDPVDGPLEFADVKDLGNGHFNVTFNDRRASSASGPVLSFDIDTEIEQTFDAVRIYAENRLRHYLASPLKM